MGRISSFKPSYEGCQTLDIRSLNSSKSFAQNKNLSATLQVSEYWEFTENVICLRYKAETHILELCFFREGKRYDQKIRITRLETNLKNGYRYFFVCGYTGKRCTKLIRPFGNGCFIHRTGWKNLYYAKQRESKLYRAISNSSFGISCRLDNLREELYYKRPKYQKTHYRGKPTPKYKKIKKLEEKCYNANNDAIRHLKGFRVD
ncbi:hypothetical protein [Aureispira anguillae]|uniref:Uncharacterized protein n=1 Tax=Aureispira anguillae TaxID=2864201 RepID=A0A916DWH8_9BACT|nr:hypothetical protein [Aureispira anguillae]BDS15486.1 hypothetical protein AsAng_0062700 [Aureispira anguillae]